MEPSKPIAANVLISCGVLFLTAGMILSLVLVGAALFVVLGG